MQTLCLPVGIKQNGPWQMEEDKGGRTNRSIKGCQPGMEGGCVSLVTLDNREGNAELFAFPPANRRP